MWKFMIFGIVVQVVLLMSILDVYVYEPDHVSIYHCPKSYDMNCSRSVMVIVAEGVETVDLLDALTPNSTGAHTMSMYEVEAQNSSSVLNENASVFGDLPVLYVGPPHIREYFNVCSWHMFFTVNEQMEEDRMMLNASHPVAWFDNGTFANATHISPKLSHTFANNTTHFSTNFSHSDDAAALTHYVAKSIMESSKFSGHRLKFVVFPSDDNNSEEKEQNKESVADFIHDLIYNSSRSCRYSFIITSSLGLLTPTWWSSEEKETVIILDNLYGMTTAYESFERVEAFGKLKGIITSMTHFSRRISLLREIIVQHFYIKGNLLDVIGRKEIEYFRDDNPSVHLYGFESMNALFQSLAHAEGGANPLVVSLTVLSMFTWISLLAMKTVERIANPIKRYNDPKYPHLKRMLDVMCVVLMLFSWAMNTYFDCPLRYVLYWFVFIIVSRLTTEEVLNFKLDISLSVSDRVKIALQVVILLAVVEGLFWSIPYKKMLFILFVVAAGARILQGAFSVTNLKTVIVLAASTFALGVPYLCPLPFIGTGTMTCITAICWTAAGLFAFKFIIKDSEIDRFVMGLCIVQYIIAAVLSVVYSMTEILPGHYGMMYFLCFGAVFAIFGGPNQSYRLMQLTMCCGAVYLFFSRNGEGLSLLAACMACFCSFLMEKSAAKKQTEIAYYVNVFPIIFFAVTLILASHVIAPVWKHSLFQADTIFPEGVPYAIVSTGIVYLLKLGYLVLPLEAAFLTSGPKVLELPNLFAVVLIFNLVSFRAYIQPSLHLAGGLRDLYTSHLTLHILSAMAFYLFPIVQVTCNVFFVKVLGHHRDTVPVT